MTWSKYQNKKVKPAVIFYCFVKKYLPGGICRISAIAGTERSLALSNYSQVYGFPSSQETVNMSTCFEDSSATIPKFNEYTNVGTISKMLLTNLTSGRFCKDSE